MSDMQDNIPWGSLQNIKWLKMNNLKHNIPCESL
jgi:hypothetical protein